jgi:short subunit dehydrogenase-like uncharacterized protein
MTADLDLVIFGATGFTGRLVSEYVLARSGRTRVGLAGRDRGKLEALRRELAADAELIVADSSDRASLDTMVKRTRVVCTTVGPYAKYGSDLVASCAAQGVDCCDLTGEPQWVRRMIDAHHEDARRSGARIVPCCGFDSIPSDLGVFMLQEHARATHGAPCDEVTLAMTRLRGGVSGGTIATMFSIQEELREDRAVRRLLVDPYALVEERGPDARDRPGVRFHEELNAWVTPFLMAFMNRKVVHRTNALGGYPYGRDFKYAELSAFRRGPRGAMRALRMSAGMGALLAMMSVGPTRNLLERALARPGEGPSKRTRERGLFEAMLIGHGTDATTHAPFRVRGRVAGKGDPGYAGTAVMLGEAALCLAQDPPIGGGGVQTPAVALGGALLGRLGAAGMTFEVDRS